MFAPCPWCVGLVCFLSEGTACAVFIVPFVCGFIVPFFASAAGTFQTRRNILNPPEHSKLKEHSETAGTFAEHPPSVFMPPTAHCNVRTDVTGSHTNAPNKPAPIRKES